MTTISGEVVGSLAALLREQAGLAGRLPVGVVILDDQVEIIRVQADPSAIEVRLEPRRIVVVAMETASHKWTRLAVKAQLDQQRQRYGWDFVFLDAN